MYIDRNEEIELSIGVSFKYSGKKIATHAIGEAIKKITAIENKNIVAYIREDNIKSEHAFSNAGFKMTPVYKNILLPTLDDEIKMFKWVYTN